LFYHKNMGAWNFGPLDNDAALDELQMLFDTSDLVDRVRTSLERGLHDGCNEIRATAYLVYVLVKHDLWPHDTRQAITSLAVTRLSQMSAENVYGNADFTCVTLSSNCERSIDLRNKTTPQGSIRRNGNFDAKKQISPSLPLGPAFPCLL